MDIYYSFWSKPSNPNLSNRVNPKFIETFKLHQECSFLLTKKHNPNDNIILITDKFGYKLIKNLNLNWSHVDISLDKYNHLNNDHWALVKTLCYIDLKPPFIHIDYDVLLDYDLKDHLNNYDVIYQSSESIYDNIFYYNALKLYKDKFKPNIKSHTMAYNAGFVYSKIGFNEGRKFIDANYNLLSENHNAFLNGILLEQYIVPNCYKNNPNVKFGTLNHIYNDIFNKYSVDSCDVENTQLNNFYKHFNYVHNLSNLKYNKDNINNIKEKINILKDDKNIN